MRFRLLSILFFLTVIPAGAATVAPGKAREVAATMFGATRAGDGSISLVWDGTDGTRGAQPPFYVFNRDGGGFVVIAADDRAYPILGYSEEGSFSVDGMPSQIRAWFDGYGRQIDRLRASSAGQEADVAGMWRKVAAPSAFKVLKTAQWGQNKPFNDKCWNGSVTGCVATATSTIMYYHKWPETTSGNALPSYEYVLENGTKRTQEGHRLCTSYSWDKMKSNYNGTYTRAEADAVSNLMYDMGVALQLSYDKEATSGFCEDIVPVLVKYFDYDSCAALIYRDEMTSAEWSSRMKDEIDAGRPLLYCAMDNINVGGHQFILDGYGSDDYFHFNFGWYGKCDGLYRLEAISPDSEYFLNYEQAAIVDIRPDAGGKGSDKEPRIRYYIINSRGKYGGISLLSGTIAKDNTVKLAANNVCNLNGGVIPGASMEPAYAQYAMCLMSRDNKVRETFGKSAYFKLESGYLFSDTVSCRINCVPELGDKFMFCYRTSGDWKPVELDYSIYNKNIKGTDSKMYNISDAVAAYDFPAIKITPAECRADELIDLRLENCRYIPTIVWFVDGKELENGINAVRLPAGRHTIKAVVNFYKTNTVEGSVIRTETLHKVINVK